jgi:hypothetical protein
MKSLEQMIMPVRSASRRVEAPVAARSARANGAKPRAEKVRMAKIEAKRLKSFKVLMKKYRGKATFAGFDA